MKHTLPFILLSICTVSFIACFILINQILLALHKNEKRTVEKLCNRLLLSIICGATSLASHVLLESFDQSPHMSIGLIVIKILGTIGPFAIGGGCAVFMFRRASKKIK